MIRVKEVRAILFDLAHTITKTRTDIISWCRITTERAGIDVSHFSNDEIKLAFDFSNERIKQHATKNDIDIHWGNEPEDWLEVNRAFFTHLGLEDVTDDEIIQFEMGWRETGDKSYELLVDDAKETLEELHNRGYILGVCTRRNTNPESLLKDWGINRLFSSIQFSGVPGYAKPSPYTLLKAAEEISINPRLCAYVGNYVKVDVEASKRAEMLPILTVWADEKERNLVSDETVIISKISELLELFTGPRH